MMDTFVYVYGTLKQGLYNYDVYLGPAVALGKAERVGAAQTAQPDFHLVLKKDRFVPCMYRAPPDDGGYRVPGEVYRVDADTLEALDILEAVAEKYYLREEIAVELLDGERAGETVVCHAYVMPLRDELLTLTRVPEYTAELHVGYKSRTRTPKLAILACLYGRGKTDAVQARIDAGLDFHAAWKEVIG
ncbi:hypothetical protein PybrP1_010790 [[Pythium] brassicae (nom. inval.)]|nr:hypothetical protein PybrP1_010790 [[Pythium] brassicae (nom. inval.)]